MQHKMTGILFALVLALSVTVVACSGGETAQSIELVTPAEAAKLIEESPDGLVVLDVRTPEEFAEQRLPNAIMIDFYAPDFADQLDELDKNVPYVMYCRTGNRSIGAAETMRDLGFTEVYEIDGGILNWYEQGFPIDQ